METKPELLGQCLTTTRAQCGAQCGAQCRGPVPCPGGICCVLVCGVWAPAELLRAMAPPRSRWGSCLCSSTKGCPGRKALPAPCPEAQGCDSLHFEVQEGPQAGQRLVCELSLSKSLRKSSHRHFGITFKLSESSCIFPPSSPPPSPCPSPLILPPLSPKTFGNFEAGRTAV